MDRKNVIIARIRFPDYKISPIMPVHSRPAPAKKRRGTYATRARREKAEAFFREYRRDRDELLRVNPRRPGETEFQRRVRIRAYNDETLRGFAEGDAGIGIIEYDSAADMLRNLKLGNI